MIVRTKEEQDEFNLRKAIVESTRPLYTLCQFCGDEKYKRRMCNTPEKAKKCRYRGEDRNSIDVTHSLCPRPQLNLWCKFCSKEFETHYAVNSHQYLCKENPDREANIKARAEKRHGGDRTISKKHLQRLIKGRKRQCRLKRTAERKQKEAERSIRREARIQKKQKLIDITKEIETEIVKSHDGDDQFTITVK